MKDPVGRSVDHHNKWIKYPIVEDAHDTKFVGALAELLSGLYDLRCCKVSSSALPSWPHNGTFLLFFELVLSFAIFWHPFLIPDFPLDFPPLIFGAVFLDSFRFLADFLLDCFIILSFLIDFILLLCAPVRGKVRPVFPILEGMSLGKSLRVPVGMLEESPLGEKVKRGDVGRMDNETVG
jgi:hypothetical protein